MIILAYGGATAPKCQSVACVVCFVVGYDLVCHINGVTTLSAVEMLSPFGLICARTICAKVEVC